MDIKSKLLALNILEDNEYLNKYCELITVNLNTKKQLYKTQKHHIIPKCYFKSIGIPVDNSEDNVVNLLFSDHVLAHYYLTLCSTDTWFKKQNALVVHLYGGKSSIETYLEEQDMSFLQDVYELGKQLVGETKKNRCYVYNDERLIMISEEDLEGYLSLGYKRGNNKLKNKVRVTNGLEDAVIDRQLLNDYLINGYVLGHSHKTSQKMNGTYCTIHNEFEERRVPKEEFYLWEPKGYILGSHPKSKRNFGHPSPYKGTHGLIDTTNSCKNKVWVSDGKVRKRIKSEELNDFLSLHPEYKLGMK